MKKLVMKKHVFQCGQDGGAIDPWCWPKWQAHEMETQPKGVQCAKAIAFENFSLGANILHK